MVKFVFLLPPEQGGGHLVTVEGESAQTLLDHSSFLQVLREMSPEQETFEVPTAFPSQQVQDAFVRVMRFIPFAANNNGRPSNRNINAIDEAIYGWLGIDREFLHIFVQTRPAIQGVNYGDPNNVYNPDETIDDEIDEAVARRKQWQYNHEPSITGETYKQRRARERNERYRQWERRYEAERKAQEEEYKRRTRKGARNPYAGPRQRRYHRYPGNSNSEGSYSNEDDRNYHNRIMAAIEYDEETGRLGNMNGYSSFHGSNNNNDDEYPFAPETENMTDAEFEKWLRTYMPKAPLNKTVSLNGFFNETRNLKGRNNKNENKATRNFFTKKNAPPKKKGPVESAW